MLPGFWGPWLPTEHLIDFANAALTSKDPVQPINMISEGYRTHTVVTGPMNFKKIRRFFFRKTKPPWFWGTWLPSRNFN